MALDRECVHTWDSVLGKLGPLHNRGQDLLIFYSGT